LPSRGTSAPAATSWAISRRNWLEWNDRFRDDVRRFWKGDRTAGDAGDPDRRIIRRVRAATAAASTSSPRMTASRWPTRSAYEHRHNHANGEDNRDGHGETIRGIAAPKGRATIPPSSPPRGRYARAMLGTLFASTGTIMLTAGDEFGRSQHGNNNAYCPGQWC
jgi:glycogen debranching enzyme